MSTTTIHNGKIQKLTVLLFYADGNHLKETEQMEKQLKDFLPESELFKINVRTNPKMGESFHVRQTPLMLILQNGIEIWRQEKVISESGLLHYLGLKNSQQENELREN